MILIRISSPLEHLLGTIISYRNCVLQQIHADITTLWFSNSRTVFAVDDFEISTKFRSVIFFISHRQQ